MSFECPIGWVTIEGAERGLHSLYFYEEDKGTDAELPACLVEARRQLDAYFAGSLKEFDLPLAPVGTDFQRGVWNALLGVAYGQTKAYRDIALALNNEKAVRAVGAANGQNPISVIIPCHRVIGSNGTLTGYGGGLWRKEWLLKHERTMTYGAQTLLFS